MEKTSNASRYCKNTLIALLLLLCMQTVFFGLNLASAALPKAPIEANIEKSLNDPVFANIYDYDQNILGSRVSYDNNRFIISVAQQTQYDSLVETTLLTNIDDYDYFQNHFQHSYWRYWHGWQFLTNLCLLIGPVSILVAVVFTLVVAATAFFLFQLQKYTGWLPACIFTLIAFFATNIFGNFMGDILLAISTFALVACCGLLLKLGKSSSPHKITLIALTMIFAGGLYNYLDFLTIPAFVLTLAITSGLLAIGCTQITFKKAFGWLVGLTALFMLGYIFTWVSKWVLVAIFIDPNFVLTNIAAEMNLWTNGATYEYEGWRGVIYGISPRLFALVLSLGTVVLCNPSDGVVGSLIHYPAGIIAFLLFVAACIFLIVEIVKTRSLQQNQLQAKHQIKTNVSVKALFSKTAILYLPCLFVPVYIALMANHTIFHIGIFGYKSWAIVCALLSALFLWTALQLKSSRDVLDDATNNLGDTAKHANPGSVQ